MNFLVLAVFAQLAAPRQVAPVLTFPEPGVDDTSAYQGYSTRFYRGAAGNTIQVYLNRRDGRVVHLLANSENESIGFSARGAAGRPAPLRWDGDSATAAESRGGWRTLQYDLVADASHIHLGWFLLGSMRVERDFQYAGRHRAAFESPPFVLPELERLMAALSRLGPAEQREHLSYLRAGSLSRLRARLLPTVTTRRTRSAWTARAIQPSLDGSDSLMLEVRVDPERVTATRTGDSISLRGRSGERVRFTVVIGTSARPLNPLTRDVIFTPEFLRFVADAPADQRRWMERQVRGVELLSSREKLMAGLPAYATYFGRDMQLSALMMRPIWRDEMSEFVVASVLRKLSPLGQVSHEEALGGQAVREAAAEYASVIDDYLRAVREGNRTAAAGRLARARVVLRDHRVPRENYHMIDDEFQLPVLAARWLGDPDVTRERKRAFLMDSSDGGGGGGGGRETRLERLLRELALVSQMTADYVRNPVASSLVSFASRDSTWASASWRDSGAGYAGGRYAMDVNVIWVPQALQSVARILEVLGELGISIDAVAARMPELRPDMPLGRYWRDPAALGAAIEVWSGASRHFLVRLGTADVRAHVAARLRAMPEAERQHWSRLVADSGTDQDSLVFLALSLDADGRPIGVANSDPATRLFLGDTLGGRHAVLRDVRLFARAYPVGLLVGGVGPVVANDAYAPPRVWRDFERDHYHGPRVVWGREVNLFLLGVADRIQAGGDSAYVNELREAVNRVRTAAEASGFQSELWSYEVHGSRVVPVRYSTGSDVQLWSTTDLAVAFALSRMQ